MYDSFDNGEWKMSHMLNADRITMFEREEKKYFFFNLSTFLMMLISSVDFL